MSTMINRGRRTFSPQDLAARERKRLRNESIRATHRRHEWACPNCGHRQITEYPIDPWEDLGHFQARCEMGADPGDFFVCGLLSRISLTSEHAPQWVAWTEARWAYDRAAEEYQRSLDGFYADVGTWDRPTTPPPRWATVKPPCSEFDALRGLFDVRLLEARTMASPPAYARFNLPSGHVHARIITSYQEDGHHKAELDIPQPLHEGLRDELLRIVADPDERRAFVEDGANIVYIAVWGPEPWCWTEAKHAPEPSTPDDEPTEDLPMVEVEIIEVDEADHAPPDDSELIRVDEALSSWAIRHGVTLPGDEE